MIYAHTQRMGCVAYCHPQDVEKYAIQWPHTIKDAIRYLEMY